MVAQDEGGGFDVLCLVVVEAYDIDHLVEAHRVNFEYVLECEAGRGELGLEAAHGDSIGGVFGLRRKHKCYQGLEALVLRFRSED